MSKDVLLVIDVQNVYLPGQPWGCVELDKSIENIKRLIEQGDFEDIVFTKYLAPTCPRGTWREYNREYQDINNNPWMNEFVEDIDSIVKAGNYKVYVKDTYSCYSNKELVALLNGYDRVVLCGVVAECCVLFTLFSGIDAGHRMVYIEDACAGIDKEHEDITKRLAMYYSPMHSQVMTTSQYLKE